MTDRFTIELQDKGLLSALNAAMRALADPRDMLEGIGALLERNVQMRFDTKTAPDGTQWLPLAASTRVAYAKANVAGSLLERTRQMRDSLTHNVIGARVVEVGFSDPVAIYHETGTRRGLPRRQLLTDDPIAGTLGADDRQDVLDLVNSYLQELL